METADLGLAGEPREQPSDAEQQEINVEGWTSGLEDREARVTRREAAADARNGVADERERAADERERLADERERLADARERLADEREALADEREQRFNDLEARADARARAVGLPTETVPERVLEMIARGRAMLAASSASLDRSEAAIERPRERDERHQQEVDREVTATGRDADSAQPDPAAQQAIDDRVGLLRARFLAAAADLVRIEEQVADTHEHLGARDPAVHAQHLLIAHEARESARHARQAAAHLASPGTNAG